METTSSASSSLLDSSFDRREVALLAFGRRTSACPDLPVLMQDAVALIAEVVQAEIIGSGEVLEDGETLFLQIDTSGAVEEFDGPLTERIPLRADSSMAAFALESGQPIVSADLEHEERFRDDFLLQAGIRAGITLPLRHHKQRFGTLGVYHRSPREFGLEEIEFAEIVAHMLTAARARLQLEEKLQRQQQLTTKILELADSLIVVLDAQGMIVRVNQAIERATGMTAKNLRGKPFAELCHFPEGSEAFAATLSRRLQHESSGNFQAHLDSTDRAPRVAEWTFSAIAEQKTKVPLLVVTGTLQPERPAHGSAQRDSSSWAAEAGTADSAAAGQADGGGSSSEENGTPRSGAERRTSPRKEYRYTQSIAPIYGGVIPSRNRFFSVKCCDISAGGVSFFLDEAPDFKDLVVALGQSPSLTHFTARVARVVEKSEGNRTRYLVGCRFTGRVHF